MAAAGLAVNGGRLGKQDCSGTCREAWQPLQLWAATRDRSPRSNMLCSCAASSKLAHCYDSESMLCCLPISSLKKTTILQGELMKGLRVIRVRFRD